jgi:hypothetical protein
MSFYPDEKTDCVSLFVLNDHPKAIHNKSTKIDKIEQLKNCNIFFPVSLLTEKDREELAVGLIVDVKYQCSKTIAVENLRCKVNKKQLSCVNPGIFIDISDGSRRRRSRN